MQPHLYFPVEPALNLLYVRRPPQQLGSRHPVRGKTLNCKGEIFAIEPLF